MTIVRLAKSYFDHNEREGSIPSGSKLRISNFDITGTKFPRHMDTLAGREQCINCGAYSGIGFCGSEDPSHLHFIDEVGKVIFGNAVGFFVHGNEKGLQMGKSPRVKVLQVCTISKQNIVLIWV